MGDVPIELKRETKFKWTKGGDMKRGAKEQRPATAKRTTGPSGAAEMKKRTIAGQPSWVVQTPEVELAVTQLGGHMAPVTFCRNTDRPVQPYYVSSWQGKRLRIPAPVLVPLRGDFFCLPFGGNAAAFEGRQFPGHGEPATATWTLAGVAAEGGVTTLTLVQKQRLMPGCVTKQLSLVNGQNVVYCRHVIDGCSGPMPLGHHASLRVPEQEGAMRVAVSPFTFGLTCPILFSDPANREYQSLAIGAEFTDLRRVPLIWKEPAEADGTRYPARRGFTDLMAVFSETPRKQPAWVAATVQEEGYVWFALKDPAVQPATVLWIQNGGRHGFPWNGGERCLGLEDVCAFFAEGLAASVQDNVLSAGGVPTCVTLSPDRPTAVNYIQGVARIPDGFECVKDLAFAPGEVTFRSVTGKTVAVPVRHEFVRTGALR